MESSIKIIFNIGGKEFKTEMRIGYSPSGCCNVDGRVREWFSEKYEEAIEFEKVELKRLNHKYKSELEMLRQKYAEKS